MYNYNIPAEMHADDPKPLKRVADGQTVQGTKMIVTEIVATVLLPSLQRGAGKYELTKQPQLEKENHMVF